MLKLKLALLVSLIITGLMLIGVLAYGAQTECHNPPPDPPDCPECPEPPPCPTPEPPKPCPTCPSPGERIIKECCKIELEFILDGKHYHNMERVAVPHIGDTIIFGDVRGKVISEYWIAGENRVQLFCKTVDGSQYTPPERSGGGCDLTLQYVVDGKLKKQKEHCDVPRINDVVLFNDGIREYIVDVYWYANSDLVIVSGTSERNDVQDSVQEAEVEQSGGGCFINSIR